MHTDSEVDDDDLEMSQVPLFQKIIKKERESQEIISWSPIKMEAAKVDPFVEATFPSVLDAMDDDGDDDIVPDLMVREEPLDDSLDEEVSAVFSDIEDYHQE